MEAAFGTRGCRGIQRLAKSENPSEERRRCWL